MSKNKIHTLIKYAIVVTILLLSVFAFYYFKYNQEQDIEINEQENETSQEEENQTTQQQQEEDIYPVSFQEKQLPRSDLKFNFPSDLLLEETIDEHIILTNKDENFLLSIRSFPTDLPPGMDDFYSGFGTCSDKSLIKLNTENDIVFVGKTNNFYLYRSIEGRGDSFFYQYYSTNALNGLCGEDALTSDFRLFKDVDTYLINIFLVLDDIGEEKLENYLKIADDIVLSLEKVN